MDCRVVVMILFLVFETKSQGNLFGGCTFLSAGGTCSGSDKHFEYQYPNEKDMKLRVSYSLDEVVVYCVSDFELDNYPGRHSYNSTELRRLLIANCKVPANLLLAKFAEQLGIENLEDLSLGRVRYEKTLDPRNFKNLSKLEYLTFVEMDLTYLEERLLEGTPNLKHLSLQNNIINYFSESFLRRVPELNSIALFNFNSTIISLKSFHNLTNIKAFTLDLSRENVKLDQYSFFGLSFIEYLSIGQYPLGEIQSNAFDFLKSLKGLELHSVRLKNLPARLFAYNQQLIGVRFRSNDFFNITLPRKLFGDLPKLLEVEISHFGVVNIPADMFNGSVQLKKINLSTNNIRILPDGLFDNLENLKVLNIAFNQVEIIPDRLFRDLKRLQELNLHFNRIKTITK